MTENGNARVTVAVLGNRVNNLSKEIGGLVKTIDRLTEKIDERLERTTEVEKCIAVLKNDYDNLGEKVDDMKYDLKDLKDKNKLANIGIAIGEIVVGIMAAIGIRQ